MWEDKFWRALDWKSIVYLFYGYLEYISAIGYILWAFGIYIGHFGIFYGHLVL
jgi:hypothetical protein